MLILSDCPDELDGLVPRGDWAGAGGQPLSAVDQALWRALGSGTRPSTAECRDARVARYWSHAVVVREASTSQFDLLREGLAAGLALSGPTACLALSGSFHGQHGRRWLSAPGNLHLSVAFPSPALPARAACALTMLPALALVDAVRSLSEGRLRPGIKWVNDILLDGRKLGGVLTTTQVQGESLAAVVFGLGLNVSVAPPVEATPFVPGVTSLAGAGAHVALIDAFRSVLAAAARLMARIEAAGPASLIEAYRAASLVIGREVCVFGDEGKGRPTQGGRPALVRGTVRGIADDLSLVLDGSDAPVSSGRLAFCEDCGPLDR